MNVVVIGGAGRVGAMVVEPLMASHHVRVVDRDASARVPAGAELVVADVTDAADLPRVVAGQDAVVFLAMGALPQGPAGGKDAMSGPAASTHFDVSVKGLYLTLHAAAAAGVRRVVYASSMSIFDDYLDHGHVLEDRAPDAVDGYGLTKRLGEEVCRAAAVEHGLSVTALRLCGPLPDADWQTFTGACPEVMTAGSDVGSAFLAAVDKGLPGFEALLVTGDHEERFITWTRTRELLGWRPRARR